MCVLYLMFISLVSEFVVNVYFSNGTVECDTSNAILGLCVTLFDELTSAISQLGELRIEDEVSVSVFEVCVEVCISVTLIVLDVLGVGFSVEGLSSATFVVATFSDALTLIQDVCGIISRRFAGTGVLVESTQTDLLSSCSIILESISEALRPVSLALRIFTNITSGVLISALTISGSTTYGSGTLLTTVVDNAETVLGVLGALTSVLTVFETVVGVIQTFVYVALSVQYARNVRRD